MKPRYAVINQNERDKFEKKWQLPYGYKDCFITTKPQEAIDMLEEMAGIADASELIIEKIEFDGQNVVREFYYRI